MKKRTISLLHVLFLYTIVWGQAFPCLDQFYVTQNEDGSPTTLYLVDVTESAINMNFNATIPYWANAIGFNPNDRRIYGVKMDSDEILRIDANGSAEVVGRATGIGSRWLTGAGDCTRDGKYIVHHRTNDHLYFFNVTGGFTQERDVELVWHPSSGNSGVADLTLTDLVVDPENPLVIYTHQLANFGSEPAATRNHLLRIDADPNSATFGNVFDVVELISGEVELIGALFMNSQGELYGYGSITSPPNHRIDRMIKIDITTGETILMGIGPEAAGADGCSCPYTVVATKEVEQITPLCEEAIIDYRITVQNKALETLSDLTFHDELPDNATITDVEPANPFNRPAAPTTGIGTSQLVYNNIDLNVNDSISFVLSVRLPLGASTFSNQFALEFVPSFLGGTILSDDPTTITPKDATIVGLPSSSGMVEREEVISICTGSSYEVNGMLLTDPGVYEFLLESEDPTACDTLLSVELMVTDDIQQTEWVDICAGETYTVYDSTLTASGTYVFALPASTSDACDTLVTVQLTEYQAGRKDTLVCILEGKEFQYFDMTIDAAGVYEYVLPSPTVHGCDSIMHLQVEVISNSNTLYVPNAFSPGIPDGINDYFTIYPGPATVRLERLVIFNRWGGKVYELYDQPLQSPIRTWDGRMNGKFVEEEVFVYLLEVEKKDGSISTQAGSLVLF